MDERDALDRFALPLEELEKEITKKTQDKYYPHFEYQACYVGNGIYSISGLYSTDTRELFLMFCLQQQEVEMDDFSRTMKNLKQKQNGKRKR